MLKLPLSQAAMIKQKESSVPIFHSCRNWKMHGKKFSVDGNQEDAIQILKDHGFNYIRLRIFVNPGADSGYSKKGYCSLNQTLQMAKRIYAAKMKFLLDFHYSDFWADPGKQFKPQSWKNLSAQGSGRFDVCLYKTSHDGIEAAKYIAANGSDRQ